MVGPTFPVVGQTFLSAAATRQAGMPVPPQARPIRTVHHRLPDARSLWPCPIGQHPDVIVNLLPDVLECRRSDVPLELDDPPQRAGWPAGQSQIRPSQI